ncbi:hypothetical protein ABDD95_15560 [Mucilaginibacter sp. PAMB04274]|uniref:hypothetical protein n=1 Tax=Mucilaginibacter sp. PAMB04274 TaxID=3138568 RepID=UPI0031F67A30
MIKKTLQTLTGTIDVAIPTSLHELRLGQLMAMQATDRLNDLQAIHILSGVPLSELQQIQHFTDLQVFNDQVTVLANEIKNLYNSSDIPETITFYVANKPCVIKVIKNLSVEPAGAFMAARDLIADEINKHITLNGEGDWQQTFNPSLQLCSQILAHYFYCRVTKLPYDELPATEFTKEIEKLPVTVALPVAKYFFLSYPHLSKPKTGFWHHLHRLWNSVPALKTLKLSGTLTRLMLWPAAISPNGIIS